ncbi:MAG: hypothetical protein RH917_17910 [Lacipirellulaceae bacterium]
MTVSRALMFTLFLLSLAPAAVAEGYLLEAAEGQEPTQVTVKLQVGGDSIVPAMDADGPTGTEKVTPMSVQGNFEYQEQVLGRGEQARSVRVYQRADAILKIEEKSSEQGFERVLPEDMCEVVCDLHEGRGRFLCPDGSLTRSQVDLLDVLGNTLVLDRLLPNREVAEGESWEHDPQAITAIFGLDNAGVCEVNSMVVGEENNQVQIRMSGTVHGGVDGASLEMEIKGAYLFHLKQGRITKMNLVVKEKRKASVVTPGLDITAKLNIVVGPATSSLISEEMIAAAEKLQVEPRSRLFFNSPIRGFRFAHAGNWYVTKESRNLVTLRLLDDNTSIASCNVTTLPPRSAERETSLEQFQREVQQSLGENVQEIAAANEWTSPNGHKCMAVFANGKVKDIAVQWRYYLVSAPDVKRVSVAATVEQAKLDKFADADRLIVDSMELVGAAKEETAGK